MLRTERGITLIALVITIVVLLILVEVSIIFAVRNDGIITQASNSIVNNRVAKAKEEVEMAFASARAEYYADKTTNSIKILSEYLTPTNLTQYTGGAKGTGTVTKCKENLDGSYTVKYKANDQKIVYTFTVDKDGYAILEGSQLLNSLSKITLSDIITSPERYYGKTVNYLANGIADWKIFYSDGSNIYLISSDYVAASKLPITEAQASTRTEKPYSFFWNPTPESAQTPLISGKTWNTWTDYSTYQNGRCVSTLLKTSNWSSFVNDYAEYAIGGPTIEMWVESVNNKYPSERQLATNKSEHGFNIYATGTGNFDNDQEGYFLDLSDNVLEHYPMYSGINHAAHNDKLYFPYTEVVSSCKGYWLASPNAFPYMEITLFYVINEGAVDMANTSYMFSGIRPVVCLNAEVTMTEGIGEYDFELN